MVCLLAAPRVQLSVSAGNGWPHNALRHHWLMPISCHFGDCKALLVTSLTRVSGAIASVQSPDLYLCNCRHQLLIFELENFLITDAVLLKLPGGGAVHCNSVGYGPHKRQSSMTTCSCDTISCCNRWAYSVFAVKQILRNKEF